MLCRFLRLLLGIRAPLIPRDGALRIALHEAQRRGVNPGEARVSEGLRVWIIHLRWGYRPGGRVVVDSQTGNIIAFSMGLR